MIANESYWAPKLARNRQRDRQHDERLLAAGWTVLRFWEHETPADVAEAIKASVLKRQPDE